ncbi:MAG: carboxylating nicotinate-nucleotide diphosphorylase [Ignavibacteria bacterium]
MKYAGEIDEIIKRAFAEDIGTGDITTLASVAPGITCEAKFLSKAEGILSGIDITQRVFHLFDSSLRFIKYFENGNSIEYGNIIAEVKGSATSILSAERTALNFLQRMSGIATLSNKFAEKIKHTATKIIDTRKTAPGLRLLDKIAVENGGCHNHRMGLYDMFLIKDNHIAASGSISNAVNACREYMKINNSGFKIEVEVTNLEQTKEALDNKADIIMLDNFEVEAMHEAVNLINKNALTEASGGISLNNVQAVAETGVDFISVGALTHSVRALDISLNLTLAL